MAELPESKRELADALEKLGGTPTQPRERGDSAREMRSGDTLAAATAALAAQFPGARPVQATSPDASLPPPKDLGEAYRDLVDHEKTKPREFLPPPPPWWTRFVHPALITVCLLAITYLWVAKPTWLHQPPSLVSTPADAEGADRLLRAVSYMVEDFVADSGRLPRSLSDLGIEFPTISFAELGNGAFRLETTAAPRFRLDGRPGTDPIVEALP